MLTMHGIVMAINGFFLPKTLVIKPKHKLPTKPKKRNSIFKVFLSS